MQTVNRFTAVIVTLLLGASLCAGCSKGKDPAASKPPAKDPEVATVTVQPQTVTLNSELPGRVISRQIAEVRPQVSGIIQQRLFKEGSEVRQGTPLYQIDSATYQAAVDTAAAQLTKAQATLATSRSKAKRSQELANRGLISRDSNDDQQTELKQFEADVAVAEAALKTARINLAYTTVKAPISGYIGKSSVTAGALVTANQTAALSTIQQLDPILVDITQASTSLLLGRGASSPQVSLLLPDGKTYAYTGKLEFTEMTVDEGTGAVTVRAEFPNPERQLLPGLFVRAKLDTGVKDNALLIPQQGLVRKPNGDATVWVVKADNSLEQRPIKVSQAVGNQWVVETGLTAGEQIVVEGFQKIRPNVKVKAVAWNANTPVPGNASAVASNADKPLLEASAINPTAASTNLTTPSGANAPPAATLTPAPVTASGSKPVAAPTSNGKE